MSECEIWGWVSGVWEAGMTGEGALYEALLDRVNMLYPGFMIVDSSKTLRHLRRYEQAFPRDVLHVAHLIRDFRGWVMSQRMRGRRKGGRISSSIVAAYRWLAKNCDYQIRLARSALHYSVWSYEEIVFNPDEIAKKVLREFVESVESVEGGRHHIVLGNRMRGDWSASDGRIRYDHGWFREWWHVWGGLLLTPVYIANRLWSRTRFVAEGDRRNENV